MQRDREHAAAGDAVEWTSASISARGLARDLVLEPNQVGTDGGRAPVQSKEAAGQ